MSNETEKKDQKEKSVYRIAKGKALTSKAGILSEGDEVKAEYFADGKKTMDAFMKTGHIVK